MARRKWHARTPLERDAQRQVKDMERRLKHCKMAMEASAKYAGDLQRQIDLLRRDLKTRDQVIHILRQTLAEADAMWAAAQRFD